MEVQLTNDILYGSPFKELKSSVDSKIAKIVDTELQEEGIKDYNELTKNVGPENVAEDQIVPK